jgi:hypothetical protein
VSSSITSYASAATGRPSKSGGSGREGLLFQLQIRIPPLEHRSEFLIQRFDPRLVHCICCRLQKRLLLEGRLWGGAQVDFGGGQAVVVDVYSTRWIKALLSTLGLLTIRETG